MQGVVQRLDCQHRHVDVSALEHGKRLLQLLLRGKLVQMSPAELVVVAQEDGLLQQRLDQDTTAAAGWGGGGGVRFAGTVRWVLFLIPLRCQRARRCLQWRVHFRAAVPLVLPPTRIIHRRFEFLH